MKLFTFILVLVWAASVEEYNLPSNKDIVIITRDLCSFSKLMRKYLNDRNIEYEDINVSLTGRDILNDLNLIGKTFPMVFVHKVYIGGYRDGIKNKRLIDYIEKHTRNDKSKIKNGHSDFISQMNSNL